MFPGEDHLPGEAVLLVTIGLVVVAELWRDGRELLRLLAVGHGAVAVAAA